MDLLQRVISERPSFHLAETEVERAFEPAESLLPATTAARLAARGLTCYGLGADALAFIADTVTPGSRTLETGAGSSTLVFALRRAYHLAITPSAEEIERIRLYAASVGIGLDTVEFVAEPSERCLPTREAHALEFVLLDGKHAFPWPVIDWFYTAEALRRGGIMLVDDVPLRSVGVLADFMHADPAWEMAGEFSDGKTLAFRKVRERALDVAWHMQPWTVPPPEPPPPGRLRRLAYRLLGPPPGARPHA